MVRHPAISVLVLLGGLAAACGDDGGPDQVRPDASVRIPDAGHPDRDSARPEPGGSGGRGGHDASTEHAAEACEILVTCDSVPGPALEAKRCEDEIDDGCADCVLEAAAAALDEDGGADGCASTQARACDQACLGLVATPERADECEEIVAVSTSDPQCLCEHCLDAFAQCVEDSSCLRLADCCGRAGQYGTGCFFVPECMGVILELGPTSVSTALATAVGRCVTDNACGPSM